MAEASDIDLADVFGCIAWNRIIQLTTFGRALERKRRKSQEEA